MTEEFQEKIKEIMEKVRVNSTSLHISRIPKEAKDRLVVLANKEFAGDYGMVILWLLDFRDGLLASPNQQLAERIDFLAEEINKINQRLNAQEVKQESEGIRMLSGRVLKRRGGIENEQISIPTG